MALTTLQGNATSLRTRLACSSKHQVGSLPSSPAPQLMSLAARTKQAPSKRPQAAAASSAGVPRPDIPAGESPSGAALEFIRVPPTPTLPSGAATADSLLVYQRMLQHAQATGDAAAQAGEGVLEQIRIGLTALLHHPRHGVLGGATWQSEELELERVLCELQKDFDFMHRAHDHAPARLAVQMASYHCEEAARILRHL